MSTPQISSSAAGLRVSGDLTFATVTTLLAESRPLFVAGSAPLLVDLSAVAHADSAGLALLIEWSRLARGLGRELHFQTVPPQMQAIASASGLTDFLAAN
ncbi:MAG: STAS domain-containing protein [Thiohalomonadaceae bacterium]